MLVAVDDQSTQNVSTIKPKSESEKEKKKKENEKEEKKKERKREEEREETRQMNWQVGYINLDSSRKGKSRLLITFSFSLFPHLLFFLFPLFFSSSFLSAFNHSPNKQKKRVGGMVILFFFSFNS